MFEIRPKQKTMGKYQILVGYNPFQLRVASSRTAILNESSAFIEHVTTCNNLCVSPPTCGAGNLSAAEAWFVKAQDARIRPDVRSPGKPKDCNGS